MLSGEATEAELIAHCKERLAGYKAPTSVEFRDSIPRTATGKIQKFKLASRTGPAATAASTRRTRRRHAVPDLSQLDHHSCSTVTRVVDGA